MYMYKVLKSTFPVIVLFIRPFVLPRSCYRRHRGLYEKERMKNSTWFLKNQSHKRDRQRDSEKGLKYERKYLPLL